MVKQFLIESLVFSIVAGGLGLLLALWALSAIQSIVAPQLPPNTILTLNWRALAFTGGVTLVTALLVGLAPAIQASRAQIVEALKDSARGSSGERGRRFRATLIVAEVALSVVLLVGSSLLLVSFLQLQRTHPGFEARGAASAFVGIPNSRYTTTAQQSQFFAQVVEQLRAQPGVTDAAVAIGLPVSGFNPRSPYSVGGRPILPLPQRPIANLGIVSEGYFRLMRITLAAGRAFTADDREGAPGVCIINESFARRLFPGESPLGHTLLRGRDAEVAAEIVGVIRDVKTNGLNAPTPDEIYYPMRQLGRPGMAVVGRVDGDPASLQSAIRAAVAAVDRNQPISFFATLETNISQEPGRAADRGVADRGLRRPGAGVVRGWSLLGPRLRGVPAEIRNRHPDGTRREARTGGEARHAGRPPTGGHRSRDRPCRGGGRGATDSVAVVQRPATRSAGLWRRHRLVHARRDVSLPAAVAASVPN